MHPNEITLLHYMSSGLTEDEQIRVDTHLADCSECARLIHTLRYLHDNFNLLLNSWTAAEHGRVYRQCRVAMAMTEIASSPSLADHSKLLYNQLKRGMGLGVKILLDRSKRIASLANEDLPRGYRFMLRPLYTGVGTPQAEARLRNHLKKGSEFLAEDKKDEALQELLEASKIDARSAQSTMSELYYDKQLIAETSVDSRRGYIWVKFWRQMKFVTPAIAVLIPEHSEGRASVAFFEQIENESYVLAEFKELDHKAYSLWFGCGNV